MTRKPTFFRNPDKGSRASSRAPHYCHENIGKCEENGREKFGAKVEFHLLYVKIFSV
jgi:hypothetical protein